MRATMLERGNETRAIPALARNIRTDVPGGAVLGRIGPLEVRLARDGSEIAAAQAVRFRVFYEELGARRHKVHAVEQRDADRFDAVCDHLLVLDTSLPGSAGQQIVGTYRLLRQESAIAAGGFYSDEEFQLESLISRHPDKRFLELGRSCVLPNYRSKRTIELLWQGIYAYISHYNIAVMTGCASFHGTEPSAHAEPLSFLAHNCRADEHWDVKAVPSRFHRMDLMPADAIDPKAALAAMPPLVKGYLRLGAKIGDGCVIDEDFGTTDVFIILPVEYVSARYLNYYGAEADRFAA